MGGKGESRVTVCMLLNVLLHFHNVVCACHVIIMPSSCDHHVLVM